MLNSSQLQVLQYHTAYSNFITAPVTINCGFPYDTEIVIPGTIINSPNYPRFYSPDNDCKTTIRFSNRIRMTFLNFDVEEGIIWCPDFLEIYDGPDETSSQIGPKLCGQIRPIDVESTGNILHILFHTDDVAERTGFQIKLLEIGENE